MEYGYNPSIWGPGWIWGLGFFLFMGGIVLAAWFLSIARGADRDRTPPREIPGGPPEGAP